jgi:hypothetical protein
MAESKKWVLLATAPDRVTAEIWTDILVQEGIPAMVNPHDTMSRSYWRMTFAPTGAGSPYRVMVTDGYQQQAHDILDSLQPP